MENGENYVLGELLEKINTPDDLRKLEKKQLNQVSNELRQYIVDVVSKKVGILVQV